MELFKITCLTCRARLSVRDAALVGQIIGCPRCGMMVQVTPPADSAAVAAAPVVAPSMLPAKADEVIAGVDEQTPPVTTENANANTTASVFEDAEHALAAIDDAAPPPSAPPAPVATTTVTSWSAFKFAVMLVAAATGGAAMVGLAIAWLRDDPAMAVADDVQSATTPAASAPQSDAQEEPPAATPQESEPAVVEVTNPVGDEAFLPIEPTAEEQIEAQPPSEEAEPSLADKPSVEATQSREAPTPQEPVDPATNSTPDEPEAQPRLRIDPLDIDPEGLDLTSLYAGPRKDPLAESHLPAEEEPAPSVPEDEPAGAAAEAPPPAPEIVRRDEQAGDGVPTAVETLFARRLPAVRVTKAPLCRFVDLAVQLSGLPVSVDPNELRMAAVTAATPVSVDVKDATIVQLLTTALEPLRLKPIIEDEHLVLVRSADDARRAVDYPVDDLAKTPEQVKQLAQWINQLAAPEAWSENGGDATLVAEGGQLRVDGPTSVQYQVLFVLERYRLARGLPTRTKYPSSLLATGPAYGAIAERLSAPAQFTFSQYAPLREVFRFWQEELDVAVLVAWPALAEERLWPQSGIACSASGKSWAEAMDSVLQPLGLAWRAVDGRTIEITTLAKVNAEPQFEIYRMRADATVDREQLADRIQSLANEQDAAQPAQTAIIYDTDSQVLFTRHPATVHRRIVAELSELLEPSGGDAVVK